MGGEGQSHSGDRHHGSGSGEDPADQYFQETVHLPEGRTGAGELLRGYPEDPF